MRRSATGTRPSEHRVCRGAAPQAWNAVVAVRRVLAVALPFALSASLAACMVGPDFKSADPPVAQQWLEAGDPAVRTDRQDYEQWWQAFYDPTLNNLVDVAYRQNLTLLAAGTRVLEARAALAGQGAGACPRPGWRALPAAGG